MRNTIVVFMVLSLFIVACELDVEDIPMRELEEQVSEEEAESVEEQLEEQSEPEEPVSCTDNSDCGGKKCINSKCSTVAELYAAQEGTDCEKKCNFDSVTLTTNDDQTFTLSRGESTYSYAGALPWGIVSGPDYCPMDNVPVPIKIEKVTTGKKLGENIITLKVGETSEVITHPTIERIAFTVTLESIDEKCD